MSYILHDPTIFGYKQKSTQDFIVRSRPCNPFTVHLLSVGSEAFKGNFPTIRWAASKGNQHLPKHLIRFAAEVGNIECIKYLRERDCKWNKWLTATAAANGHLNCLQYAFTHNCVRNSNICTLVAKHGHLECLKCAHSNGCSYL